MTVATPDELRIIASDTRGMLGADRDALRRAADEYEFIAKELIETQARLIESQQQRIATNERLLELQGHAVPVIIPSVVYGSFNVIPLVPVK